MRRAAVKTLRQHNFRPKPFWASKRACSCSVPLRSVPRRSTAPLKRDNEASKLSSSPRQDLFIQSPFSPGSPLFPPRGASIFSKLIGFMRAQYARHGFQEVVTPNIYKSELWKKSGHWDKYSENMFDVRGHATNTRNPDGSSPEADWGLKPMNCPGHCLIFKDTVRSFRDLPIRYADFSSLHRDEVAGALAGLTRIRRFHQDDGHIFCRPDQVQAEIFAQLRFVDEVYKTFGFSDYDLVLSTRPDEFIGEVDLWDQAETRLSEALNSSGRSWTVRPGDGAFYGPKIDIILRDRDGKTHQTATIQLDFQMPLRMDLTYVPSDQLLDSSPHRPIMIHRAVFGSLERFMSLLIERHSSKPWPFWLNPYQVMVIPVNDHLEENAAFLGFKKTISGLAVDDALPIPTSQPVFRVDTDSRAESVQKRVSQAKAKGYSMVIVVGERDTASGSVTVSVDGPEPPATEISTPGKRLGQYDMTFENMYNYFCKLEREYK